MCVADIQRKKLAISSLQENKSQLLNLDLQCQSEASQTSTIISFAYEISLEIATSSICIHLNGCKGRTVSKLCHWTSLESIDLLSSKEQKLVFQINTRRSGCWHAEFVRVSSLIQFLVSATLKILLPFLQLASDPSQAVWI